MFELSSFFFAFARIQTRDLCEDRRHSRGWQPQPIVVLTETNSLRPQSILGFLNQFVVNQNEDGFIPELN